MTLHISDNIRKFRKEKDLTQEQLAKKLGVSAQAVSRWENGSTYPDVALIPALAEIFSVTTDQLFGVLQQEIREEALETFRVLEKASFEDPFDVNTVRHLLFKIRKRYLDSPHLHRLFYYTNPDCLRSEKILPDIREIVHARLDDPHCQNRFMPILAMVDLENDDRIDEFMDKYATPLDLSFETLFRRRYRHRKEWKRYDPMGQRYLILFLDELLQESLDLQNSEFQADPAIVRMRIDCVHLFAGQKEGEGRLISGNGEVDCFIKHRLWFGILYSSKLAVAGKKETALEVLEDAVTLLEKGMEITERRVICCNLPWFQQFRCTVAPFWDCPNDEQTEPMRRRLSLWYGYGEVAGSSDSIDSMDFLNALQDRKEWKHFDVIREDPRFLACLARVEALVVHQSEEKQ